jgi:PAS domain S-box-containing protein
MRQLFYLLKPIQRFILFYLLGGLVWIAMPDFLSRFMLQSAGIEAGVTQNIQHTVVILASAFSFYLFYRLYYQPEAELWQHQLDKTEKRYQQAQERIAAYAQRMEQPIESVLQQMVNTSEDILWSFDLPKKQLIFVSQAFIEIYGYPIEMVYADLGFWKKQVVPEDRHIVEQISNHLFDKQYVSTEYRIIRADGSSCWVLDRRWLVSDAHGKPLRIDGVVADINRQKTVEAAMRRSIAEMRNIRAALNQSAMLSIADRNGTITEVNDSFCHVSGYQRHELIGRNHRIMKSGHHSSEFFVDLWRTISRGRYWRGEIMNKAKDGSFYWVDTTINPVFDEKGQIYEYLSVRYLITDRKKEEAEREALIKRLSRFAFITSHKLRRPLANILGLVTLFDKQNAGDPFHQVLIGNLSTAAQELDQVIHEMNETLNRQAGATAVGEAEEWSDDTAYPTPPPTEIAS